MHTIVTALLTLTTAASASTDRYGQLVATFHRSDMVVGDHGLLLHLAQTVRPSTHIAFLLL